MIQNYKQYVEDIFTSVLDEISTDINQIVSDVMSNDQADMVEKLGKYLESEKYSLVKWIPASNTNTGTAQHSANEKKHTKQIIKIGNRLVNENIPIEVCVNNQYYSGKFIFCISKDYIKNKTSDFLIKHDIKFVIFNEHYDIIHLHNMMYHPKINAIKASYRFHKYPLLLHIDYDTNNTQLSSNSTLILLLIILVLTIVHIIFYVILNNGFKQLIGFSINKSLQHYYPKELISIYNRIKQVAHDSTQHKITVQNLSILNQELQHSQTSTTIRCQQLHNLLKTAITDRDSAIISNENVVTKLNQAKQENEKSTQDTNTQINITTDNLYALEKEVGAMIIKARKYSLAKSSSKHLIEYADYIRCFSNYVRNYLINVVTSLQLHLQLVQLKTEEIDLLTLITNCTDKLDYECDLIQNIEESPGIVKVDVSQIQLIISGLINCITNAGKYHTIHVKGYTAHGIAKVEIGSKITNFAMNNTTNFNLCINVAYEILLLHNGNFTHSPNSKACYRLFTIALPVISTYENK